MEKYQLSLRYFLSSGDQKKEQTFVTTIDAKDDDEAVRAAHLSLRLALHVVEHLTSWFEDSFTATLDRMGAGNVAMLSSAQDTHSHQVKYGPAYRHEV